MKRIPRTFFGVLLALFLLAPPPNAWSRTVAPGQPRPSDAEIQAKIHTKLAKSKIGKDGFQFHVKGGVVTWEGKTAVMQHKGAATRMARTSGAIEVVNHIQIAGSAGFGRPPRKATVEAAASE